MSSVAISVESVSKAYLIGLKEQIPDSLVSAVGGMLTSPWKNWKKLRRLDTYKRQADAEDIYWALRNISFEVQEGEVLGIVGRNGAGKSTLLKILSRITEPTSGRAVICGRVSSLLEVGTGFHPELSGRENVYLNGTILGMTKREIDRKFDEIVDFSGVEQFLDTPIKRYSSGMKVRLAFAVAAHLEPEILIIDEVLAVGDASFQKRCMDRMSTIAKEGKTILFVSHNLDVVDRLCTRAILLKRGSIDDEGPVQQVISKYLSEGRSNVSRKDLRDVQHMGDGRAHFARVELLNTNDEPIESFETGDTLRIAVTIDAHEPLRDVNLAVILSSVSGARIVTGWNREAGTRLDLERGVSRCVCDLEGLGLRPGHELWLSLWLEVAGRGVDYVENVAELRGRASGGEFERLSTDRGQGIIVCRQRWRLAENAPRNSTSRVSQHVSTAVE